ncbi:MAG: biotin/lipoyl-containing protein [Rudaea sp.]
MKYTATIGDKVFEVEVGAGNTVSMDGQVYAVDFHNVNDGSLYSLLMDNRSWEVLVEHAGSDEFRVTIGDEQHAVTVEDERTRKIGKGLGRLAPPSGEVTIKAPMPGLVRAVPVETWQEVSAGQGVVILEAMKMENELRTPKAGVVSEIKVKQGDKVEQGQVLVVIK